MAPDASSSMAFKKRIGKVVVILCVSLAFTCVYFTFFKHPPPDVLLVMNKGAGDSKGGYDDFGASSFIKSPKKSDDSNDNDQDENADDEDEDEEATNEDDDEEKVKKDVRRSKPVKGVDAWQSFLKKNKFVAIGAVYDKCENWDRQIGSVVMVEDKEFGGVKSRTYINMTIAKTLDAGQFHLEVKYNGQDLYDNYWELCELEDDLPVKNKTFVCPVKPGFYSKLKEKHVPGYLPTGRYQAKGWAVDDDEKVLACAYADFRI